MRLMLIEDILYLYYQLRFCLLRFRSLERPSSYLYLSTPCSKLFIVILSPRLSFINFDVIFSNMMEIIIVVYLHPSSLSPSFSEQCLSHLITLTPSFDQVIRNLYRIKLFEVLRLFCFLHQIKYA